MKRILVVLAILAAGCAAPGTEKVPDTVEVPVAVACVRLQDVPAYPAVRAEAEIKALPDYQATLQLWLDAKALRNYAEHAAVLLRGCSEIPAPMPRAPSSGRPSG